MRLASALIGLATLLPTTPTPAQAVYRCVEKGKPVTFQSAPCARTATTTSIRGYVPEPTPTSNELAWKRYRTEQEMTARNNAARRSSSTSAVVLPSGGAACAQAKADRDAWERSVGLRRTVDGMRFWQDRVYQACR